MDLPSPKTLKRLLPLTTEQNEFIASSRQIAKDIFLRKDPRLLLICGPCSLHHIESSLEYGRRLKALADEMADDCYIIMRAFIEKPRTLVGWKGILYDPHLDESHDIARGLSISRQLFLDLTDIGLPLAMEFVDPIAAPYFDDLISWGVIGARTAASQPHRQLASGLSIPIGFKNGTDGNIDVAIHGAIAASVPHQFFGLNEEGRIALKKTTGNPYSHVVLRGAEDGPNFDPYSVREVLEKSHELNLHTPLLIDCSHGNSSRNSDKQAEVFYSVIEQIRKGNNHLFGMMLESHIENGNQPYAPKQKSHDPNVSITDPCLSWDETESLIKELQSILINFTQS